MADWATQESAILENRAKTPEAKQHMLAKLTVDLKYVEEQFDKTLEIVPLGLKSQAAYLDQLGEFFDQNGKARGSVKFLDAILNQIGPQQYVNKVRIIKDGLHGAVQANNAIVTMLIEHGTIAIVDEASVGPPINYASDGGMFSSVNRSKRDADQVAKARRSNAKIPDGTVGGTAVFIQNESFCTNLGCLYSIPRSGMQVGQAQIMLQELKAKSHQ